MRINIEIGEEELKKLIIQEIKDKLGSVVLDTSKVKIMVKSKQNYKSEWEPAAFKAIYESSEC